MEKRRARGMLLLPPMMPRASEALVMRAERHDGRLILAQVHFASTTTTDDAAADDGGEIEAPSKDQQAGSGADKAGGGVVAAAQQHVGGCISGELCQVAAAAGAAGRRCAVMGI
ncbi:hypothetical protein BAE44_0026194 [Dichanthelium oligosanthes]|uniref:Uncharacterized protein n=1 Tax=Dichanthelium oligosanthes TaxID=888268 RepID=A0A1E5UIU8_9POAL|nr:hypothetical protein BAE44_0026194 [Dichanthelium oligosanthes]